MYFNSSRTFSKLNRTIILVPRGFELRRFHCIIMLGLLVGFVSSESPLQFGNSTTIVRHYFENMSRSSESREFEDSGIAVCATHTVGDSP